MAGHGQFNPPGLVLFRLRFNVDTATAADFNRFIQQVERELCSRIQRPRHHGTGTTVLPRPQARRTWFVIELESDREMRYIVPVFIEAETIYLRGYQNQLGALFEFAPNNAGDNQPYLGRTSTSLGFSCNYESLVPSTVDKRKRQPASQPGATTSRDTDTVLDPGLVLEPLPEPQPASQTRRKQEKREVPRPNFGQRRLRVAVRELAEGKNIRGESHHRTAQNLLLVIIRFCESIRFRSIRAEMVDLWTVESSTGQPSRCLTGNCFGQIKNWNQLAINLQDSARHLVVWPSNLAEETGVHSAADAQAKLIVVLFREYPDEPGNPIPEWGNPPDNNNHRRHGGPGAGPGGSAGGVLAAEIPVPRWLPVPEEPVMEILGVYVPRQRGLQGVYGTVTVYDGLGAQAIYRRSRDNYQRNSGDSEMSLELNVLDRSVSAYDCCDIVVDLCSASTGDRLSTGRISWSICDFSSNTYDRVMRRTIGQAVVEYVVYSKAMQVAVSITVDNDEAVNTVGWFTTMNTTIGVLQPSPRRPLSHAVRPYGGPHMVLHGDYVVAVPLFSRLQVFVKMQHKGSRGEVGKNFGLEPTGEAGSTTMTETLPQVGNVEVKFTWNLLRMAPTGPSSSSAGRHHDGELRRRR